MDGILSLVLAGYVLFIIYDANQVHAGRWQTEQLRLLLYSLVIVCGLIGILAAQLLLAPPPADVLVISPASLLLVMGVAAVSSVICFTLLNSQMWRERIASALPTYDPDSAVHLTAIVLMLVIIVGTLYAFVIGGGLSGLQQTIVETDISAGPLVLQAGLFVGAAVIGVGLLVRRNGQQLLSRLGLVEPSSRAWWVGIGSGVLFYIGAIVYSLLWSLVQSPESIAEQTQAANAIAQQIDSLALALVLAVSAGVGEEILIRGALQPVFGIALSSAFFTLLHTQYLGTPTMGLIFGLSVGFGYIRREYNTTTAIIAHAVYNFIPFLLIILLTLGGNPA